MTIEQQVLERLRDLPGEKQQEVLDFVDFLKEKNGGPKKPRRSLRGLWADLNVHITEEDIAELAARCGVTAHRVSVDGVTKRSPSVPFSSFGA
jgi:hypothetical protein